MSNPKFYPTSPNWVLLITVPVYALRLLKLAEMRERFVIFHSPFSFSTLWRHTSHWNSLILKVYVREREPAAPFVSMAEMMQKFNSSTRDLSLPQNTSLSHVKQKESRFFLIAVEACFSLHFFFLPEFFTPFFASGLSRGSLNSHWQDLRNPNWKHLRGSGQSGLRVQRNLKKRWWQRFPSSKLAHWTRRYIFYLHSSPINLA